MRSRREASSKTPKPTFKVTLGTNREAGVFWGVEPPGGRGSGPREIGVRVTTPRGRINKERERNGLARGKEVEENEKKGDAGWKVKEE